MSSKDTPTIKIAARLHATARAAVAYVELGYDEKAMWVGAEFITLAADDANRLVSLEIAGYYLERKLGKMNDVEFVVFNPTGKTVEFIHDMPSDP